MGSGSLLAMVARVHSFRRNHTPHESHQDPEQPAVMRPCKAQGSGAAAAAGVVGSFHEDLTQRLQQLQLQGGSAHLNWLLDACTSTLSTHSSLVSALSAPNSDTRPAYQRSDEVLSMLDACTSLKQVADDVERQLARLQAALQSAGQALLPANLSSAKMGCQRAARRLKACLDGLQALSSSQCKPIAEAQSALLLAAKREVAPTSRAQAAPLLDHALDGTLLISLLVLASAMATFAPPRKSSSHTIRSACKLITAYTSGCKSGRSRSVLWASPLRQLQCDLKQEEMSAVFLELQEIHTCAASIHATISGPHHIENAGEARQSTDMLCKRSQEVKACISLLRSYLASLFEALLELRLALLG